jgi:acetyltransferase-like isoleucine patch superfamily enzyme
MRSGVSPVVRCLSLLIRAVRSASSLARLKGNPIAYARSLGVRVGEGCDFINLSRDSFGSEPYLISIGSFVTLSGPVRFITHDGAVRVIRDDFPSLDVIAPIKIGNHVFVGPNTIFLPGVSVGDHSIIGAGSVVTRDVPAGVVMAGNPARHVRTTAEYAAKARDRGLQTKTLSPAAKRRFLRTHFANSPTDTSTTNS